MQNSSIKKLAKWYQQVARVLPWRQTSDPYAIWISEVMLQQTQVATVIPYYEKFLRLFPNLAALAKAEESTVLRAWSGLGYYSRARNLQKGAQFILEKCGGKFPRTREAILEVPGIGPYTAGAILSIAFDLPVPLVDGNVQRVFARFFGIEEEIHLKAVQARFWQEAECTVTRCESPRIFNQALMELGATVCTKGTPRCEICPLSEPCVAKAKNLQASLPKKKPPRKKVDLYWAGFILESRDQIFLHQNPKGQWWEGMWDLPRIEVKNECLIAEKAAEYLFDLKTTEATLLQTHKHTVTHHAIRVFPYRAKIKSRARMEKAYPRGGWFPRNEIRNLPISSLVRKVIEDPTWDA